MANTPVNNYRIYIGFTKAPDNDVCNLSLDVSDVLDDHPVFTTPPFTAASAWVSVSCSDPIASLNA